MENRNKRINDRILYIRKMLNRYSENLDTYLDLGCGDCTVTSNIAQEFNFSKIYGADIIDKPKNIPSDITYIKSTYDHIPLESNSVDLITCFVCIHHFTDPTTMLCEIYRVLKPGGYLYFREHDVMTRDDQAYIDLIHIIMSAKNNEPVSFGYYASKEELSKTLISIGFNHVSTSTYSHHNPQRLYHSLFQKSSKTVTDDILSLQLCKYEINPIIWIKDRIHIVNDFYRNSVINKIEKQFSISKDVVISIIYKCNKNNPDDLYELLRNNLKIKIKN